MANEHEMIVRKTLAGIVQAQSDYYRWSDGLDLREAPEYMITTSVARQLAGIRNRTFDLTLEQNIRNTDERFDIVLWNGDDPRAAIEIKKIRNRYNALEDDLDRICETLHKEATFDFGLAAYYIYKDNGTPLQHRMDEIDTRAYNLAEDNGFNFQSHGGRIRASDDICWAVAVLEIAHQ